MKVPFLDLKAQINSIRPEIDGAISRVIDSACFVNGPVLNEFEASFSSACNMQHGIGTSSGTTALHLALVSTGVNRDDEVILPANTFIATAEAVVHCGATPVFVDVDETTALADIQKVKQAITKKTRAIIAVHLFGQLAPMDQLGAIARENAIRLIEDAAQAHLAAQNGKFAGSTSDCACFSFFPGKNLGAFGDAGMILTNDKEIAERCRMLRDHGRKDKYLHEIVGFNSRMDPLQAAVLSVKFRYLEKWNQARRERAKIYDSCLKAPIRPLLVLPSNRSNYHLYVVQTPQRDALRKFLAEREIDTGIHYPVPLHLQPAFSYLEHKEGDFPVAESLATSMMSLPLFPEMTNQQQEHVISSISEYFAGKQ